MALRHRHRSQFLGDSLSGTKARDGTPNTAKHFDQAYFDKWYRHPTHRVKSPAELARQVAFVLHTTEWVLGRPVRSVLDVGCGEGQWRAALRKHRPRLQYTGVDPSEWAVAKHGKHRGLMLGGITSLDTLPLDDAYDLVVCCGMLNYLAAEVLTDGDTVLFVEPGDRAVLAARISELLSDAQLQAGLSKRALDLFDRQFSLRAFQSSLLGIYRDCCGIDYLLPADAKQGRAG